tara:strand:+ start:618 stop:2660 length:2043 start_codon:yes stop_codon:yes gene_type:complete
MATSKNKEMFLYSDANDMSPFAIEVSADGKTTLDVTYGGVSARDKNIEMICDDLVLKTAPDSNGSTTKQNVRASLNELERSSTNTHPYTNVLTQLGATGRTASTVAGFSNMNDSFQFENNRAVAVENYIEHRITDSDGPFEAAPTTYSDASYFDDFKGGDFIYGYTNINKAVGEAQKFNVEKMRSIVAIHNIPDENIEPGEYQTGASLNYRNVNQAVNVERLAMLEKVNELKKYVDVNNVEGTQGELQSNVFENGRFHNFNDAFVKENIRAIRAERSIRLNKTVGDAATLTPKTPVDGTYDNINQAFVDENTRAVTRENEIQNVRTYSTPLGDDWKLFDIASASTWKTETTEPVSGGSGDSNELFKNVQYNEVTQLDEPNLNLAVLKEHRRAVMVENEINKRVEGILAGTTSEQLDSLSEIVQMFTRGDVKLTQNLQEFSRRYNGLVNDFNTLSESHQKLLDRFNETFTGIGDEPAYSAVTRAAVKFNVNTGLVNSTLVLNDVSSATDWDRRTVNETGGLYEVRTAEAPTLVGGVSTPKTLCLPMGDFIASGATLIVRRVDLDNGTTYQPVRVKWDENTLNETSKYFILSGNRSEVVLLGTGSGWIVLKPTFAQTQDPNTNGSGTWIVNPDSSVANTIGWNETNTQNFGTDASGNQAPGSSVAAPLDQSGNFVQSGITTQ